MRKERKKNDPSLYYWYGVPYHLTPKTCLSVSEQDWKVELLQPYMASQCNYISFKIHQSILLSHGEHEALEPTLVWDTGLRPLWTYAPVSHSEAQQASSQCSRHESGSGRLLSANKAFSYAKWRPKSQGAKISCEGGFGSQSCKSFFTCPPPAHIGDCCCLS